MPKYLFTPFQVVRQASFSLHGQSQDALSSVCNQLILCRLDMCDYNLVPFKPLDMC